MNSFAICNTVDLGDRSKARAKSLWAIGDTMLMRPIQAQSRCAEYAPMGLTFTTLGLGAIGVLLHGFL